MTLARSEYQDRVPLNSVRSSTRFPVSVTVIRCAVDGMYSSWGVTLNNEPPSVVAERLGELGSVLQVKSSALRTAQSACPQVKIGSRFRAETTQFLGALGAAARGS